MYGLGEVRVTEIGNLLGSSQGLTELYAERFGSQAEVGDESFKRRLTS